MNIGICDDDRNFRKFLSLQLNNYFEEKGKNNIQFFEFDSGEQLLKTSMIFDLLFLDVEMEKINGIHTGQIIKERSPHTVIFIITSYQEYLDDAFRTQAFRFIQKPVDIIRLHKALNDTFEFFNNTKITFTIIHENKSMVVFIGDIIYVETFRRKVKVVTTKGNYYSREAFDYWKKKLNAISFIEPHNSYIVNLDYMTGRTRSTITLSKTNREESGEETYVIPVASRKQSEVKKQIFYIMERK